MSFLFGGRKQEQQVNNNSGRDEGDRLRNRQISSLLRAGAQAISHDQTVFDVPIHLSDNKILFLRITLGDRFPMQAPCIMTTVLAQHAWIDSCCNVRGHPDLINWSAHSDIGRVVTEIVQEFQRHPPHVPTSSSSNHRNLTSSDIMEPPPHYSSCQSAQQQYRTHSSQQSLQFQQNPHYYTSRTPSLPAYANHPSESAAGRPVATNDFPGFGADVKSSTNSEAERPRTQTPTVPAVFPQLDSMSMSQLEKLSGSPLALHAYISEMESVKNLRELLAQLKEGNEDLARNNVDQQVDIEQLRSRIEVKKAQYHEVKDEFVQMQAGQQQILSAFEPPMLLELVSKSISQADMDSDDIATKFVDGEMSTQNFVGKYVKVRKNYHLKNLMKSKVSFR